MRWRAGQHVIVRGADWQVVRTTSFQDCSLLEVSMTTTASRTFILPFDRPRLPAPRRLRVVSRRHWARDVSALVLESFPYGGLQFCPPAIRLLPYQLEPALALLRHGALRVLIADDVGLGKTVEAGLVIRELAKGDRLSRVLILCPAALRTQWAQELSRLFSLRPIEADAAWLQGAARDLPPDVNPWSPPGVYLASVDFVKRPEALRPLEDVRWDLLVVDEAHGATPGSDRGEGVHALACRARRLILLTATPHSGNPEQFNALCRLGAGPESPPLVLFNRSRQDTPLAGQEVKSSILQVRLGAEECRMHRLLEKYTGRLWAERSGDAAVELVATLLRKRALSSPASLARSIRRRMALLGDGDATPGQMWLPLLDDEAIEEDAEPGATLGTRGLQDPGEERTALEAIASAADAASASEAKLRVLLRLLRRSRESAIVFSEYRDTAGRVALAIAAEGREVEVLHGGLSAGERRLVVSRFTAGATILVATDAASEGLNLHQACRMVVHFELPWTPSRLHQRCGRVNRIGQTRRVHEIALIGNDTAEALVLVPLLLRDARSGVFSRAPLVHQLTESRIAARIMTGVLPAPPASPPRSDNAVTMDLRDEASKEAVRLETLRRLSAARSARGTRPLVAVSDIPIVRPRRQSLSAARSLVIVTSVSLLDGRGVRLEHHVLAISYDLPQAAPPRRHSELRRDMQAVLAHEGLARFLDDWTSARIAALSGSHAAGAETLFRHVVGLERQMRSTARQLVQAGLFDRRALRSTHARAKAHETLLEEVRARLIGFEANGEPGVDPRIRLEGRHEVRAVLIGSFR